MKIFYHCRIARLKFYFGGLKSAYLEGHKPGTLLVRMRKMTSYPSGRIVAAQ